MFLKKNYILNEGYQTKNEPFHTGVGSNIFIKKRKFLDLSLCAGSLILGHSSKIFKKALKEVVNLNISNFAAKNSHAQMFSRTLKKIFPNYSKFIFCNSGTEAVFKSLRIARALSKKNLIISVTGSWHGSTSELLYTKNKNLGNKPLSAGLDKALEKNLKFIPYNDIENSKKILHKYRRKIMCIIIEPIQGCLPLSAKRYLKFLSTYSKKNNIILIFDEMITGLRYNGASAQKIMKLDPSISTFGKCFGGGLPLGIIAIKKNIEKKIFKKKNNAIFFGGTFSGNAINTYVGNEVSSYIIKNKKKIFKDLDNKSKYLEEKLNDFFISNNSEARCLRVSSMLRIIFSSKKIENRYQRDFFEKKYSSKIVKFRNFLFSKNIYYPSSGIMFLATSTSYKSIDDLINTIKIGFKKIFN